MALPARAEVARTEGRPLEATLVPAAGE
jgi:hypothetical protein